MSKEIKTRQNSNTRALVEEIRAHLNESGERDKDRLGREIYDYTFSSEIPYERAWGTEILSHDSNSVDLTPLNDGGVVLWNHDHDQVIGAIVPNSAYIGEDRRCHAQMVFEDTAKGIEIKKLVDNGTIKTTSVGYSVEKWDDVYEEREENGKKIETLTGTAVSWTAHETSFVSVPADKSVGIGRIFEIESKENMNEKENLIEEKQIDLDNIRNNAIIIERNRVSEIDAICKNHNIDNEIRSEHIDKGTSVDEFRKIALNLICQKSHEYSKAGQNNFESDYNLVNRDKFVKNVTDSLLVRSGIKFSKELENTYEDPDKFSSYSLRDLAIKAINIEDPSQSISKLLGTSKIDLFRKLCHDFYSERKVFNPSAVFPSIMDNVVNKSIVDLYTYYPTTFQIWTTKGTLPDFKETSDHQYVFGGLGKWPEVPENGELVNSYPETKRLANKKLKNYGLQFSMTYEAFVNDDIGFLARTPAEYARTFKESIEEDVYRLLVSNPEFPVDNRKIFDICDRNGNPLTVDGAHNNTIYYPHEVAADGLIDISELELEKTILRFRMAKDYFGRRISQNPRYILVPLGYEFKLGKIFKSAYLATEYRQHEPVASMFTWNPMTSYESKLQVIECPWLNDLVSSDFEAAAENVSLHSWYMMGGRTIEVDYLDGREIPYTRRAEAPGYLGFMWDMWGAYGVTWVDYRGAVRHRLIMTGDRERA